MYRRLRNQGNSIGNDRRRLAPADDASRSNGKRHSQPHGNSVRTRPPIGLRVPGRRDFYPCFRLPSGIASNTAKRQSRVADCPPRRRGFELQTFVCSSRGTGESRKKEPNPWRTNSPQHGCLFSSRLVRQTRAESRLSNAEGSREFKSPSSPPSSPSVFGRLGESIEIRACARDFRLRMDPESGSGGVNRGNTDIPSPL